MAAPIDSAKQGAELQRLHAEGRVLQRTLAAVASDYGVYLKKYNDTSERIHADSVNSEKASMVTVAETSSNNAIVLVLIDGMSHKFHNELYRSKQSGGAETAKRLRVVVRERVAAMLPAVARSEYYIVVKIFACLKTLLSRVAAEKLATPGPRSLAFHFAEFNKISPFFDFVDAGDEGFVPTKIIENFKSYMASEQCKHVFFCAAGSPKYHSALEPCRERTKRVTIVTGFVADKIIPTLGLPVASFVRVFKARPLSLGGTTSAIKPASSEASLGQITPGMSSTSATVMPVTSLVAVDSVTREVSAPPLPSPLPTQARYGRVPINLAKQRLDLQIQMPTPAELQANKERTKTHELCSDFHLSGHCVIDDCKLSHGSPLSSGAYCVLKYKALGTPCPKGSGCRSLSCMNAHICQKEECARAGGKAAFCGLSDAMYVADLHVAEWVVGI